MALLFPRIYNSLTWRVIGYSSLWSIVALVVLGWLLVGTFRTNADRDFEGLLLAQYYTLIAGTQFDENGDLIGRPELGDPNFRRPRSGWYWSVMPLERPLSSLSSPSLDGQEIERVSFTDVPYDNQFTRGFVTTGPFDQILRVMEAEIDVGGGQIVLFQVAGNQSAFEERMFDYARQISTLLGLFALGVVGINALVIIIGLRPLDGIRRALAQIREGRAQKLEGEFPRELRPLASEMNALIDNNRRILERARTQVGNLAHSLKTPLSVLANEADLDKPVDASLVDEQTQSMQYQVQHYLDRARIAAQRESVVFRTDAKAGAQKLVGVMRKLNPELDIEAQLPNEAVLFAGESEDYDEILGNLLENACKWARSKVVLRIMNGVPIGSSRRAGIMVHICDDGPGIPEAKRGDALKRGTRLDETVPGTGLGLAIVKETIASYEGEISLGVSSLGGLQVRVGLPQLRD